MKQETAITIVKNYQPIIDFLEVLIWPFVVIIIVLLLKKTIINLINRITKIGYGKLGAETTQQQTENSDKALFDQSSPKSKTETIDKALGLFSQQTLSKAENVVNRESNVGEINDVNDKVNALHRYSQALYLILSCERLYNLLFGSQLFILEQVNTTNSETKTSLKQYYDSALKKYPEFYETYNYEDYFAFLVNSELIVLHEDETCAITTLGRDLLKYLVETGKSLGKRY